MEKYFECLEIKLKEQHINKRLQVNLIKTIKTKYGDSLMLYDSKHDRKYFANSLLKAYLNKVLDNLKHTDNFYYKNEALDTILEFKIVTITIQDGKEIVQLSFIKNKENVETDILPLSSDEDEDTLINFSKDKRFSKKTK